MPSVDDPFGIAASLPGQVAEIKRTLKDLSVNRTQSPNILTVGAGGLTDLGPLAVSGSTTLTGPTTLTGGVTGPVAATGALSGTSLVATGPLSGTSLTVTGAVSGATVTATGAVTAATVTAPSGVSCLDARSRVLASAYASLWVDSSGQFGQSPSSLRYKQNINPATIDTTGILGLVPKNYRLKVAVADFGDAAPVEVGLIAEEVEPVAPWAVYRDAAGAIQGINYDRFSVGLLAVIQGQQTQIDTLNTRLKAAGL